jgi:hypothetical protein
MTRRPLLLALTLGLALPALPGCFLVAAGAGAGAAVAYTNRGASANVPGTVDAAFERAVRAFGALSISETGRSTEDNGAMRRLIGRIGETEVTVDVRRESAEVAKVEVIARNNPVDYDKERAKEVLDRIVR